MDKDIIPMYGGKKISYKQFQRAIKNAMAAEDNTRMMQLGLPFYTPCDGLQLKLFPDEHT